MLRANRLTLSVRFTESLIGWRVRSQFGSFPEGIKISQKVGKILGLKAFGEAVWHDRDIASSSLFDVVKLDPNAFGVRIFQFQATCGIDFENSSDHPTILCGHDQGLVT